MTTHSQRRRALLRLACIALAGALIFSWLLYRSATAQSVMLLRLWHDQDGSATVSADDMPAANVAVTVTEQCTESACAASRTAYSVLSDTEGYVSLDLQDGTSYDVTGPCMALTVVASEVSGQAVQDVTTCGLWRVWMAVTLR